MKMRIILISVAAVSLASTTALGQDVAAIAETCNGCHGEGGVSQWTDTPTIAGIDAFTQSEALYVYRDEARPCAESEFKTGDTSRSPTTMCAVAGNLSDDDIEAISDYYAGLSFVPAKQDFDAALAEKGAALHEAECSRCHSDGGSNVDDEASILAGQWMGYLEAAFAEYASGDREQPKQMKEKLDPLSGDDIKALLNYYASQQ